MTKEIQVDSKEYGESADRLVRRQMGVLSEVARSLGVPSEQVASRVAELRRDLREAEREIERLRDEVRVAHVRGGSSGGPRRPASEEVWNKDEYHTDR